MSNLTLFSKFANLFQKGSGKLEPHTPRSIPPDQEESIKLIVIGGPKVGKSSIIRRAVNDCFTLDYIPTIGVDLIAMPETYETTYHPPPRIYFWDIPSAEINGFHLEKYLRDSSGIIMVSDVNNDLSLDWINRWVSAIHKLDLDLSHVPKVLLANKSDSATTSRAITAEQLKKHSIKIGTSWKFTSALEGTCIREFIQELMSNILNQKLNKKSEEESKRLHLSPDRMSRSFSFTRSPLSFRSPSQTEYYQTPVSTPPLSPRHSDRSSSTSTDDKLDSLCTLSDSRSIGSSLSDAVPMSPDETKKYEELQSMTYQFYSRLESDLQKIFLSVDDHRKRDLNLLEKQRLNEYNLIIKQAKEYKFSVESFGDMFIEGTVTLDKLQRNLTENIKKWKVLLDHLDVELKISSSGSPDLGGKKNLNSQGSKDSEESVYRLSISNGSKRLTASRELDSKTPREKTPRTMGFGYRNIGKSHSAPHN